MFDPSRVVWLAVLVVVVPQFADAADDILILPPGAKPTLLQEEGAGEGPAWHPGGYLVFSDIPNNELKKWTKEEGVTTFRKPSQNINGNTIDLQGQLVSAEHSGRRVSVTEKDGTVKPLVSEFESRPSSMNCRR